MSAGAPAPSPLVSVRRAHETAKRTNWLFRAWRARHAGPRPQNGASLIERLARVAAT